ncbi:MAG: translation initiation factor IF-2 subunit gamma [Thermoprotei archaeon]
MADKITVQEERPELKQPLINIGTAGHVDSGKSTLVLGLSGVWTARHSEELRRGITIKLGYANTLIMKCPVCPEPYKWTTLALSPDGKCKRCGSALEPIRFVSFVDSPGHEMLMATMLSGAAVMDSAILVVDATLPCPQPQTREHFKALEIMGVKNLIVVQNKVEVVTKERAMESYKEIKEFLRGTFAENAPIIPISALHKANLDLLIEAVQKYMPNPVRDESKPLMMHIIRSFDVNKPGTLVENLRGGVLGGTILQGTLKVGDEIEILPGAKVKKGDKVAFLPIITKVTGLRSGDIELDVARPGGLIGVSTQLDPSLTKNDGMIGNVVGRPGQLPRPVMNITVEYKLFDYVIGMKEQVKVEPPKLKEEFVLNIGASRVLGVVTSMTSDELVFRLGAPVVAYKNSKVALSRRIANRWRLIGYGVLKD